MEAEPLREPLADAPQIGAQRPLRSAHPGQQAERQHRYCVFISFHNPLIIKSNFRNVSLSFLSNDKLSKKDAGSKVYKTWPSVAGHRVFIIQLAQQTHTSDLWDTKFSFCPQEPKTCTARIRSIACCPATWPIKRSKEPSTPRSRKIA